MQSRSVRLVQVDGARSEVLRTIMHRTGVPVLHTIEGGGRRTPPPVQQTRVQHPLRVSLPFHTKLTAVPEGLRKHLCTGVLRRR